MGPGLAESIDRCRRRTGAPDRLVQGNDAERKPGATSAGVSERTGVRAPGRPRPPPAAGPPIRARCSTRTPRATSPPSSRGPRGTWSCRRCASGTASPPRGTRCRLAAPHGASVKQIARRLDLSAYTVNDHLKAVFRRTGADGRDELGAALTR
ncbi:LuxR C-terminal-related transcriptional regulator [Streptomyces sp. NPDC057705]|uniref:LuxR C-terminal-related transcriptional regulator n=1 Tax=Streptomyces sp. NPDC057705 TaxID=3346222 RepID=UPI00369A1246